MATNDPYQASINVTETKNKSKSKKKLSGGIIALIVILCLVLLILVITIPIVVLKKNSKEKILDNEGKEIDKKCEVGFYYLIEVHRFQGVGNPEGFEQILKALENLRNSGVGSIILVYDNSLEISSPLAESKFDMLTSHARKSCIKVYYSIGDIGSVNTDHPWANEIELFATNKINERFIFDYNNEVVMSRIVDIIKLYMEQNIEGIYVLGLPRVVIDRVATKEINTDAIKSIKSKFSNKKVPKIIAASPYIEYPLSWDGEGIDGYINTEIAYVFRKIIDIKKFIRENFEFSKMSLPPIGPHQIWAYSNLGFVTIPERQQSKPTVGYVAYIAFMSFVPENFLMNAGDEYDLNIKNSYEYQLELLTEREKKISSQISKIIKIKNKYLLTLDSREIGTSLTKDDMVILKRIIDPNTDLILIWNRSKKDQIVSPSELFPDTTHELIFNEDGNDETDGKLNMKPETVAILRVEQGRL